MSFVIQSEDNPSTSAVAFLNGQAVLLSFSNQFINNMEYHLELVALRDTNKTPLPENESLQTFRYSSNEKQAPYIREWKYESDRMLVLIDRGCEFTVVPQHQVGQLWDCTYLSLHNLKSLQGNLMEEGNRIALVGTSDNLNNMMVYPQPATIDEGWVIYSQYLESEDGPIPTGFYFDEGDHFARLETAGVLK